MTNIPWLGEVKHPTARAKRAFRITLGKMLQPSPQGPLDVETPYLKSTSVQWDSVHVDYDVRMWASPTEGRDLEVRVGDLLICEGGDVGRAAIYDGPDGFIFQNSVHRARPLSDADPRFFKYVLAALHSSDWLDVLCNKATIRHLTGEKLGALEIPLPPTAEQRRIADFLDAETNRIDKLALAKRRASTLIDERRIALTRHLCLRGLDHRAEMRDSHIGPLGEVPAHWTIVRNKWLLTEIVDNSEDGTEELLSVSHLTGVTPRSEKTVYMFMAESMAGYKKCRPGDLIINTLWAWMGALGVSKHRGIVSPAYGVYRFLSEEALPKYFDYLYRTPEYVCEMTRHSKGVWTSRLRLYPESFLALSVPVPPFSEQREIVDRLEQELEPGHSLQRKIQESKALLTERRQALITAAVTGEFDVSSASGRGVTEGLT